VVSSMCAALVPPGSTASIVLGSSPTSIPTLVVKIVPGALWSDWECQATLGIGLRVWWVGVVWFLASGAARAKLP
jgi:hypothetical protein